MVYPHKKQQYTKTVKAEIGLEEKAYSLVQAGKYKEAIDIYKQLLQESENVDWRKQLAHCYLQRALAFSAKAMYKEALVLWENYSQQVKPPFECYDHYLVWLIRSKQAAKIQASLGKLSAQALDKDFPELAAFLGLWLITEYPELQACLPPESVFVRHFTIVQNTLLALQENSNANSEEILKELPYRSAFRDFRTILKAFCKLSTSSAAPLPLLAQIQPNSPYASAAELIGACAHQGSALVYQLLKFNQTQRKLIAEMLGLSKQQIAFVENLSKNNNHLNDKTKFNLAIQNRSLFGAESARQFCFNLLSNYAAGRKDFIKCFGLISEFDDNRLKAISRERNQNLHDAIYYWRLCIKALKQSDDNDVLKIALILRRLSGYQDQPERTQTLIESLEYDPDDKHSYLKIIDHYCKDPEANVAYQEWLRKVVARFPDDIEVLTVAAQAAVSSKSFSKVSQYAEEILATDPLNSFAKKALLNSRLQHARQLISGKKFHLVEEQLNLAESLKMGKTIDIQIQLLRGFLCFAAQDKTQGLELINDALGKFQQDPVTNYFQATLEAMLMNQPVATVVKQIEPIKDSLLSPQQLTQLMQLAIQYSDAVSDHEILHKALDKIKAVVKASVRQPQYDEATMLLLCQAFDTIRHFEFLRHSARLALSRWEKPIWMYYCTYAETKGIPENCSPIQRLRLQLNFDQARADNDHRTIALIGPYLERSHLSLPPFGSFFGSSDPFDEPDPYNQVFEHLPDDIYYKLNAKVEAIANKSSPERLFQEMNKVATSPKVLVEMMRNPDLLLALMMLRAADELAINIDVSVADVLKRFGVTA